MKQRWVYLGAFLPFTLESRASDSDQTYRSADSTDQARHKAPAVDKAEPPTDSKSPEVSSGTAANEIDAGGPIAGGSSMDTNETGTANTHAAGSAGSIETEPVAHAGSGMYAPDVKPDLHSSEKGGAFFGGFSGGGQMRRTEERLSDDEVTASTTDEAPTDYSIYAGNGQDDDAMLIMLGGTATAIGDGAETSGSVDIEIIDYGAVTVAYGQAIYTAEGGHGADAQTFYEVEGADLVYAHTIDADYGGSDTSVTYVVAIDFEEGDVPMSWPMLGQTADQTGPSWAHNDETDVNIDGHIAVASLVGEIQAEGETSLIDVETNTLKGGSFVAANGQSEQGELMLVADVIGQETYASATGLITEVDDQYASISGFVIAGA